PGPSCTWPSGIPAGASSARWKAATTCACWVEVPCGTWLDCPAAGSAEDVDTGVEGIPARPRRRDFLFVFPGRSWLNARDAHRRCPPGFVLQRAERPERFASRGRADGGQGRRADGWAARPAPGGEPGLRDHLLPARER